MLSVPPEDSAGAGADVEEPRLLFRVFIVFIDFNVFTAVGWIPEG